MIFPKYIDNLDAALENFCEHWWPCDYVKPGSSVRCINVQSGHGKGHQQKDGKIIGAGDYESHFSFANYHQTFRLAVFGNLHFFMVRLRRRILAGEKPLNAVIDLHKTWGLVPLVTGIESGAVRPERFCSHTFCLACLMNPAEHALPCGHVICGFCVENYGHQCANDSNDIEMHGCPFENKHSPIAALDDSDQTEISWRPIAGVGWWRHTWDCRIGSLWVFRFLFNPSSISL